MIDEKLIQQMQDEPLPIPPESLLQHLLDDIPNEHRVTRTNIAARQVRSRWLVLCAIVLIATSFSIWLAIENRDLTRPLASSTVLNSSYFQEWGTDPCYVQPPFMQ